MRPFYVYMLICADQSYYVGQTDDLEQRLADHAAGTFPGHTSTRRPVRLVWSQEMTTRDEAIVSERRIKGWTRAKKEALIRGDWEAISELARNRSGIDTRKPGLLRGSVRPEPVEGRTVVDPVPVRASTGSARTDSTGSSPRSERSGP